MNTKKRILVVVTLVLLGASGFALYKLGLQRGMQHAVKDGTAISAKAEKKVLYWHDPMVPTARFDKPGPSPFMDMQLVPVYADNADSNEAAGTVSISPRMQQSLGVRLAPVTRGTLAETISAVGSVAYDEANVALVQARSNGFLEKLLVRTPLETVRKGQVLAELYVPDWVAAQEEFLTVKKMSPVIPGMLDGARQRMRLVGMSEAQIALVEASGRVHARISITAPSSGVVSELMAREGMTVMNGAALFRINGLDQVWINAEIAENDISKIAPGSKVEARSAALIGQVFKGKVSLLLPEINPVTRTLKARITLANPGRQLVPGMFATISLTPRESKESLLIPSEAIIQTGTRSVVMLFDGGGKFHPVEVTVGASANGQSAILQGLEMGQNVVASGQFLIDSESSLKGGFKRMNEAPATQSSAKSAMTEASNMHQAHGKIEEIGKDEIMISHDPVASLKWGAMTMGFMPPKQGWPADIAVGSEVNFTFSLATEGQYQIGKINQVSAAPQGGKP
jgi:Cu(I)/Ag(I) efflux system membrane fusion protein